MVALHVQAVAAACPKSLRDEWLIHLRGTLPAFREKKIFGYRMISILAPLHSQMEMGVPNDLKVWQRTLQSAMHDVCAHLQTHLINIFTTSECICIWMSFPSEVKTKCACHDEEVVTVHSMPLACIYLLLMNDCVVQHYIRG